MVNELPNRVTSPPWRQLIHWIVDPIGFQDLYSQQLGDTFTMQLGKMGTYVVTGNPQAVQDIFSQSSKFDVGRGNALAEPLIGRNSLMLMDGDRHQRERKLLMPPFHGERLQAYAQKICLIAEHVASQWQVDVPFIARTEMQKISLEVIVQVVFGLSQGDRYGQLKPLLAEWLDMTDSPLRSSLLFLPFLQKDWGPWSPWGKMKRRQHHVHQLLQDEIEARRAEAHEPGDDVLSLMMAARDEQGQAMTDEELRDELLTMLFAGHETTATALAWALYQIHRQPEVRSRLLHELENTGGTLQPLDMARLPYLTAVGQETLRMYPLLPITFPRIAKEPVEIAHYSFEAETTLMPSIYLVHYREELYPQPRQFKPERFLDRKYSPAEYLPFGGGHRRCLGYALAELEMKLVLATILSQYQLALVDDNPVKLQRRGFTLAPAGGVPMVMNGNTAVTRPQSSEALV